MILIVEDDYLILQGLDLSLQHDGWQVATAKSKSEALAFLEEADLRKLDLCLLDISLPDGDGYEICRAIRDRADIPIIFLTAFDDELHTILALEQGADDYVTKPFRFRELSARIRAVLRRTKTTQQTDSVFNINGLEINTQNAKIYDGTEEVLLTAMEYRLLLLFLQDPNKVMSRQQILHQLWDDAGNYINDNTLTVYIKRLRLKLKDDKGQHIETVRGLGYRLRYHP